jgi:hypothetical protein
MALNDCDTRLPSQMDSACAGDLVPVAVCVKLKAARADAPSTKAWLMNKCIGGVHVSSFEGDNGALPVSAPNGITLSGAFIDWMQVACLPSNTYPPATIVLAGQDCNGVALNQTGVDGRLVQIVQPVGQVLNFRMCKTAQDREMVVLCAPDGTKVIVQNVTPDDAPLGTAPVFEAWVYPTSVPYTGSLAALTDCGGDKSDPVTTNYCAAGINYTRVDGITAAGVPVYTVWLEDAGIPVSAPVGVTKGICQVGEISKTGSAAFFGANTINAALLLSTAPTGSKLIGVDITVRSGHPTIEGSLPMPIGGAIVVSSAVYTQTWSSRDPAHLDDFTYTLAAGDAVDVFWVTSL